MDHLEIQTALAVITAFALLSACTPDWLLPF
jgi:hypothetical protein